MKNVLQKARLFLVAYFVLQTVHLVAQPDTNSYWQILSNSQITVQIARSNANARAEYRRLHPTKENLEMESNIIRNWKPSPPWPDLSQKREIFEHCEEVLRSAIDTNQIESICSSMTNLPAFVTSEVVISHFRDFSHLAMSNLDEFASLLSNPDLESYVGAGYEAKISNPNNYFLFHFGSDNLVRTVEKRTADAQHVLMGASFLENGKLGGFRVTSPPESIAFDADGKLISYHGIENNIVIDLRPDQTGKLILRGFDIKQ